MDFSVEFSEHRRYSQGDDPKDIDWLVYAKTDRYYVKKYQAETEHHRLPVDGPLGEHGLHPPPGTDEV